MPSLISMVDSKTPTYSELQRLHIHEFPPFLQSNFEFATAVNEG